jgi:hypothetical protein
VGGGLPVQVLIRGRLPMLFGARPLPLLLQLPPDVEILVVLLPPLLLLQVVGVVLGGAQLVLPADVETLVVLVPPFMLLLLLVVVVVVLVGARLLLLTSRC